MNSHAAELSSIVSQLDDLVKRLDGMSTGYVGGEREDIATRLIEVERSLATAARRLSVLQRSL